MSAVVIVSDSDDRLKVKPVWLGVTAYVPFAKPVKVYAPAAFAVTVAVDAPVNFTVAPLPPVPLMVPEIEEVCGAVAFDVKFALVMLAVVIVSGRDAGLKVKPVWLGVTA